MSEYFFIILILSSGCLQNRSSRVFSEPPLGRKYFVGVVQRRQREGTDRRRKTAIGRINYNRNHKCSKDKKKKTKTALFAVVFGRALSVKAGSAARHGTTAKRLLKMIIQFFTLFVLTVAIDIKRDRNFHVQSRIEIYMHKLNVIHDC